MAMCWSTSSTRPSAVVRRGDTFGARRYLHELTAYYPEAGISEEIIDVFLATDLTTVVNLRG